MAREIAWAESASDDLAEIAGYSMEDREPPHVHAVHAGRYAKFWLSPVSLASNRGFRGHELTVLREIVLENRAFFVEKWNACFGGK